MLCAYFLIRYDLYSYHYIDNYCGWLATFGAVIMVFAAFVKSRIVVGGTVIGYIVGFICGLIYWTNRPATGGLYNDYRIWGFGYFIIIVFSIAFAVTKRIVKRKRTRNL